ncbi:hypothetical protein BGZ47_010342 [Haplosporangium gracile]|nr:hypothetical protein BGZ47_010342 [Haplosporangium gracile]
MAFLPRYPNIETVRVRHLDRLAAKALFLFLKFACPKVISLEWTNDDKGVVGQPNEEQVVELIRATTLGWRILRLPEMVHFGSRALVAVQENIETLKMAGLQELIMGIAEFSAATLAEYNAESSMDYAALEEATVENHEELRLLDVRMTAHNIGVDEQWMHKNWPKLETIRGLKSPRGWSAQSADAPAFNVAVDAWMAAHPHGIESSFYS